MGEMGCRDRQSEATAEKRCLRLRTGGGMGDVVVSLRSEGENRGDSDEISV